MAGRIRRRGRSCPAGFAGAVSGMTPKKPANPRFYAWHGGCTPVGVRTRKAPAGPHGKHTSRQSFAAARGLSLDGRDREQSRERLDARPSSAKTATVRGICRQRSARRRPERPAARSASCTTRGVVRDLSEGRIEHDRRAVRSRAFTARAISSCRPPTASATRATAISRSTATARSSPTTAIRCRATAARSRITPEDGDIQRRAPTARSAPQAPDSSASLRVVDFANERALNKAGASLIRPTRPPVTADHCHARAQGMLEDSNVEPVIEIIAHDRGACAPIRRPPTLTKTQRRSHDARRSRSSAPSRRLRSSEPCEHLASRPPECWPSRPTSK